MGADCGQRGQCSQPAHVAVLVLVVSSLVGAERVLPRGVFEHAYDGASGAAFGKGPHVQVSLNASLSHDTFQPGQEVRVRLDVTFTDLTVQVTNETVPTLEAQQNTTLVCFNGTTPAANATDAYIRDYIESVSGLVIDDYFRMDNISLGSWGACVRPRNDANITAVTGYTSHWQRVSRLRDAAADYVKFNASHDAGMELLVHPYTPLTTCNSQPENTTFYYHTQDFGMDSYDASYADNDGSMLTTSAYATFVAPDFSFIMCFRRWEYDRERGINATSGDDWLPLYSDAGEHIFQPNGTQFLFYAVPAEPAVTAGDFLALKLFNLPYLNPDVAALAPPTATGALAGDNFKVVPKGWGCTYESDEHAYYGTEFVGTAGTWLSDGYAGTYEGATRGGVGVWGSEHANPLNGDTAPTAATSVVHPNETAAEYSVIYIEAPPAGEYEVCVSLQSDRLALKAAEKANFSAPVWRKVGQCPTANFTDGNPLCHQSRRAWGDAFGVYDEERVAYGEFGAARGFAVSGDEWGWSAADLAPDTWGYLRVDGGRDATARLTPLRATRYQGGGLADYYRTRGGDQMRLVKASHFQSTGAGYRPDSYVVQPSPDAAGTSQYSTTEMRSSGAPLGTVPAAGCWYSGDDAYAEFGSYSPTATLHMRSDPTEAAASEAAEGVSSSSGLFRTQTGSRTFAVTPLAATLELSPSTARIALTGPANAWFGVLLEMSSGGLASGNGYALVAVPQTTSAAGSLYEYSVTGYTSATLLSRSAEVLVDTTDTSAGTRTILFELPAQGATTQHMTFSLAQNLLQVLPNVGTTASFTGFTSVATEGVAFSDAYRAVNTTGEAFAALRIPAFGTAYHVCYRPVGVSGWKLLRFRGSADSLLPAKWRGLSSTEYPHTHALQSGWFQPRALRDRLGNVTAYWQLNDTREGTLGQIAVWADYSLLDTQPNNYHRAYAIGSAAAASEGFALRLVPSRAPCEGLHAVGIRDATRPGSVARGDYAECLDAGVAECDAPQLLRALKGPSATRPDCTGAAQSDAVPRGEVIFPVVLPVAGVSYRVCLRYGGLNWVALGSNGTFRGESGGELLWTDRRPALSVRYSDVLTAGNTALLIVKSEENDLSLRNDGEGDWFWLAPQGSLCTPTLQALSTSVTVSPFAEFSQALAVLHPQLWCDYEAYWTRQALNTSEWNATIEDTGVGEACFDDPVVQGYLCGGNCTDDDGSYFLSRLTRRNPFPWSGLVPRHAAGVWGGLRYLAGALSVPAVSEMLETGAYEDPHFPGKYRHPGLKVCYKQATRNWAEMPLPSARAAITGDDILSAYNVSTELVLNDTALAALNGTLQNYTEGTLVGGTLQSFALFDRNGTNTSYASAAETPLQAALSDGFRVKMVQTEAPRGAPGTGASYYDNLVYAGRDSLKPTDVAFEGVSSALQGRVTVGVQLFVSGAGEVTLTVPAGVEWFAVGLGRNAMQGTRALVLLPSTRSKATPQVPSTATSVVLQERVLGNHEGGVTAAGGASLLSYVSANGVRTARLALTAALVAEVAAEPAAGLLYIIAVGSSEEFGQHPADSRAPGTVEMRQPTPELQRDSAMSFAPAGLPAEAVSLNLTVDDAMQYVTLRVQGPADKWFAVGFGHVEMDTTYAIVIFPAGNTSIGIEERLLGHHEAGTVLQPSVITTQDETVGGQRRLTLMRPLQGATAAHYSFSYNYDIPYIVAVGDTAALWYHGQGRRGFGRMPPVYRHGTGGTLNVNEACSLPAASTEASPYASTTTSVRFHTVHNVRRASFTLVVPQKAGLYTFCLATNSSGGWRKIGQKQVLDNQLRYSAGVDTPLINQAAFELTLERCRPVLQHDGTGRTACSPDASVENLDLSPAGDRVKLLRVEHDGLDAACHENTDTWLRALHGPSRHEGLDLHASDAVEDLGRGDSLAKVGYALATLPPSKGDAPTRYKVCVHTSLSGYGEGWFEAGSLRGDTRIRTLPAGIDRMRISPYLLVNLSTQAVVSNTSLQAVAGGMSTRHAPSVADVTLDGWELYSTRTAVSAHAASAASLAMKWVVRRTYTGLHWVDEGHATCEEEAEVEEARFAYDAVAGTIRGRFHLPLQPPQSGLLREYMVCVRHPLGAWVQLVTDLHDATTGVSEEELRTTASGVVVYPNKVTFAITDGAALLTVYDAAASPLLCDPLRDGCTDYYAVSNTTEVCPASLSLYTALTHVSNYSATAALPASVAAMSRLKVCMLRAGGHTAGMLPRVAYHLWNSGDEGDGGNSGYYLTHEPTRLRVDPLSITWNKSQTMFVCDEPVCAVPAAAVPHVVGGYSLSARSRLVLQNEVVQLKVSVASADTASGAGTFPVWLEYCAEPSDPDCALTTQNPAGLFTVENRQGACLQQDSARYGWPASGTTQPLVAGSTVFNLHFTSPCPSSAMHLGCGFRFVADAPSRLTPEPRRLRSPPVWMSVAPQYPTGLLVNGTHVTANSGVDFRCVAFRPCAAFSFAPSSAGGALSAPAGEWEIFADHNKTEIVGLPSSTTGTWTTLPVVLSFHPTLSHSTTSSAVTLMLTLKGGSSPVVVKWRVVVVRPVVVRAEVLRVDPVWVGGGAAPRPTWEAAGVPQVVLGAGGGSTTTVRAAEGSHLAALHPYEMGVAFFDADGVLPAQALLNMTLSLELLDEAGVNAVPPVLNSILKVPLRTAEFAAAVRDTAAPNLTPQPSFVVREAYVSDGAGFGVAVVPFRLRAPHGCSRFGRRTNLTRLATATTAMTIPLAQELPSYAGLTGYVLGSGGAEQGCTMRLRLEDNGSGPVVADVVTPARGQADSLRVEPLGAPYANDTRMTGSGEVVATVEGGLTVWVQPVSVYGGFVDEFHYGRVVVLFDASPGLPATDGVVGPNGVRLVENEFSFAYHAGRGWGALAVLRPTKPCKRCGFTLHSTEGAGVAHYHSPADGAVRTHGGVLANITFVGEALSDSDDGVVDDWPSDVNETAVPPQPQTTPAPPADAGVSGKPFLAVDTVSGGTAYVVRRQRASAGFQPTSAQELVVRWIVDGRDDATNRLDLHVGLWNDSAAQVPYRKEQHFALRVPGFSGLLSDAEMTGSRAIPLSAFNATRVGEASHGGLQIAVGRRAGPFGEAWVGNVVLSKLQDTLCRDCRFEICSAVSDPLYGVLLATDLDAPCVAIRLFVTLPSTGLVAATRHVALVSSSLTGPSGAAHTDAAALHICQTRATFVVAPLIGLGFDVAAGKPFLTLAYTPPLNYSVAQQGQTLLELTDLSAPPTPGDEYDSLVAPHSLKTVAVTAITGGVLSPAAPFVIATDGFIPYVSQDYKWGYEAATADRLVVADVSQPDTHCTAHEVRYAYADHGTYMTHRAQPGAGVDYARSSQIEMGAPFLLTAYVATADGVPVHGYPDTAVLVEAQGVSACGDGGELQLYRLSAVPTGSADDRAPHLVDHSNAFVPYSRVGANTFLLQTQSGTANFWVNYTQPCQSCSLKVQLCYNHSEVTASNCLTPPAGAVQLPVLGKRTMATKPYTVRPVKPTGIVITKQNLRQDKVTRGELTVGDNVQISVRLARFLHGWVYDAVGGADVLLRVKQRAAIPAHGRSSASVADNAAYAYGGFIGQTTNAALINFASNFDLPCSHAHLSLVDAAAATGARRLRFGMHTFVEAHSLLTHNDTAINFHFTRPCLDCEVWVHVIARHTSSVVPHADDTFPTMHFPLKLSAVGADHVTDVPFRVLVKTCRLTWSLPQPELASVYKKKPFGVTLRGSDALGFPAFGSRFSGLSDVVSCVLGASNGSGNAAGGALRVTTQPHETAAAVQTARGGVVVFRLAFSRACFNCSVAFEFQSHLLKMLGQSATDTAVYRTTVLTQADVLVATPQIFLGSQTLNTTGQAFRPRLRIYAADADGDRAYTLGGPALPHWRPPYFPWFQAPDVGISLAPRAVHTSFVLTAPGVANAARVNLSRSGAVLRTAAYTVQDGLVRVLIPTGQGTVFMENDVHLHISGPPLGRLLDELHVTVGGVAYPLLRPDAGCLSGGDGLLTSPVPEALAVLVPQAGARALVTTNRWFEVTVWAVGRDPATPAGSWGSRAYKALSATGEVWVDKCASYEVDGSGKHSSVPLRDGAVTLRLRFYSGLGNCSLTVRHEAYRSAEVLVTVAPFATTMFQWTSTDTVLVPEADTLVSDADGTNITYVAAYAAAGTSAAEISLRAVDDSLNHNVHEGIPPAAGVLVTRPPHCFVADPGGPRVASGVHTFRGRFDGAASICRVTEVSNLREGTSLHAELRVFLEKPRVVEVKRHMTPYAASLPFSDARYYTLEGKPCVAAGSVVRVQLSFYGTAPVSSGTYDNETDALTGIVMSNHTLMENVLQYAVSFAARPANASLPATLLPATANFSADTERGTFFWVPQTSTRIASTGVHNPPVLELNVTHAAATPAFAQVLTFTEPIYVVVVATQLRARAVFAMSGREVTVSGRCVFEALVGQVFTLVIEAVDDQGNRAQVAGEGMGADAVVSFASPSQPPCSAADGLSLDACLAVAGYYQPFRCRAAETQPCGLPHWRFGLADRPAEAQDPRSVTLRAGYGEYPEMRFAHVATGAPVDVEQPVLLTSSGATSGSPASMRPLLFTAKLRRLDRIVIDGTPCAPAASRSDWECKLHTLFKPQVAQGVGSAALPEAQRKQVLPRTWISRRRTSLAFSLRVLLTDAAGIPLAQANQRLTLTLGAECLVAAQGTNDAEFASRPFLATWNAKTQDVNATQSTAFLSVDVQDTGVAAYDNLVFARPCRVLVLTVRCSTEASLDPDATCTTLRMRTEPLDVMQPIIRIPTPVPSRGPILYPLMSVVTGLRVSTFEQLFATVTVPQLESLLAGALEQRSVCRSITDAPLPFIERSTCSPTLFGGVVNPKCECATIGMPGVRPENITVHWVCLLTDTEIVKWGIIDTFKQFYDKCRQPAVTPARYDASVLQAAQAYLPVLEVELKVGQANSVNSSSQVLAAATQAFSDANSPLYTTLRMYYPKMLGLTLFKNIALPSESTPQPSQTSLTLTLPLDRTTIIDSAFSVRPLFSLTVLAVVLFCFVTVT